MWAHHISEGIGRIGLIARRCEKSVVVLGEGSVLHEPVPNISSQAEGTLAHALAHGRQQRQDGREAGATRIEGERSKWWLHREKRGSLLRASTDNPFRGIASSLTRHSCSYRLVVAQHPTRSESQLGPPQLQTSAARGCARLSRSQEPLRAALERISDKAKGN